MCEFDAPPERVEMKKISTENEVNNVCCVLCGNSVFIFDYLVLER